MPFLRKYATATHIYIPIVKRAVVDFAVSADWTPAAGDVKISIDGAAAANVTNLPTAITMGNTAMWDFSMTTGEMTGKQMCITVSDAATKAVEDQMFIVETYGNASAMYQADLSAANLPADAKAINSVSTSSVSAINANVGTTQPVNFTGTGATAYVKAGLWEILGTVLSETAGQIAAGFKSWFNVAAPTATMMAPADSSGTTTLLSRVSSARAGYLDNLNVGGNVASHADIGALNTSSSKHLLLVTVGQYEPGETYTVECRTFAASDGSAVNADSTPTLTATGQVSGSLSANLSAATNPATGVYRWTYTPGASPTLEQIRFDVSATIGSSTFTLSAYSQTVAEATVVWTATDQSHLTSIYNKLPTNNIPDETVLAAAIAACQQSGVAVTLPSIPTDWITSTGIAAGALNGKGDWLLAVNYMSPLDATGTANAVWNALTSAHTTVGSFGLLITTDLDAAISSRMATFSYTSPDNADIVAIKAKTDLIPADPAAVGSAMTLSAGAITTAAIADGAITDAKFTVPTEPTGLAAGILSRIDQLWRLFVGNKVTQTSSQQKLYKSDGTTVIVTQPLSDDGTTQTRGAGA